MNRRGFGSLVLILIIVAILVIGGIWYWEMQQSSTRNPVQNTSISVASNTQTIIPSNSPAPILQPHGYATILPASSTGFLIFNDTPEGFQFQFPANLTLDNSYTLDFPGENTSIEWFVGFPSVNPIKDYFGNLSSNIPAGVTSTDVINGVAWTKFTFPDESGYYLNGNGIGIEVDQTGLINPSTGKSPSFSGSDNQILNGILSSFVFTDPSLRIDHKIAQVKVGDQYGNLKVSRVLSGANGEVDFTGQLTLTGLFDNIGGGHGGSIYVLDNLDASSTAQLPQVGYPIRYNSNSPLRIYFNNQDFVAKAGVDNFIADQVTSTVVLDNFQEVLYGPGGYDSGYDVSADLMKILSSER